MWGVSLLLSFFLGLFLCQKRRQTKLVGEGEAIALKRRSVEVMDLQGEPCLIGTAVDITQREQAEQQLRESENRYRTLFSNSLDGVLMTIDNDRVVAANPAACALFQMTEEEICQRGRDGLVAPSDVDLPNMLVVRQQSRQGRGELQLVRKDGTTFEGEVSSAFVEESGRGFVIIRDISERKLAEKRLQQSQQQLQAIMDGVSDTIVWVKDLNLRYVVVNRRAEQLLGAARDEIRGKTDDEIFARDTADRFRAHDLRVLAQAKGEQIEETAVMADGKEHVFLTNLFPLFDSVGKPYALCGVGTDISARKQLEFALLAAKSRAESAVLAKDRFMATLSHELRTPLTPVLGTLSLLQEDPEFPEVFREDLDLLRRNVELQARLVDDLLDVTRITWGKIHLQKEPISICAVIRGAVEVCKADFAGENVQLSIEACQARGHLVDGDPARLQQVFWNLLKNAVKFTPPGGKVSLNCREEDAYFVVEIADTGRGIDPDSLLRIFDAFDQGTHGVAQRYGGLGLGLSITKGLVELHGGEITARSQGIDRGATFIVRLPLCAPAQGAGAMGTPPCLGS